MALLAEARRRRRRPRHLPEGQQLLGCSGESAFLRSLAEEMLREMAFAYKVTNSIRDSILEEARGVEQHQTDARLRGA